MSVIQQIFYLEVLKRCNMRKRIWIPESFAHNLQESETILGFGMTVSIAGYFIVDLIDAKSGEIKEHYEFSNLITDIGLDEIAQGSAIVSLFTHLGVGTDSTVPTVSDTALGSEVTRTSDQGGFSSLETDGGPITGSDGPLDTPYWFKRFVRHFFESEANGNLTELGWFNQSSGGTMTVRSLFKDSGGSPIVITKTSADQLRVLYEVRIYPSVGINPPDGNPNSKINSGTVILGPTTHSWTGSAMNIHSSAWGWDSGNGMLANVLKTTDFLASAGPSGSSILHPTASNTDFPGLVAANTNSLDAYSVGSFQRDMLATWQSNTANFGSGGIKIFTVRASPGTTQHFQLEISESVSKTSAERLRMKFRVQLDRTTT